MERVNYDLHCIIELVFIADTYVSIYYGDTVLLTPGKSVYIVY